MPRLLDTSCLVRHWRRRSAASRKAITFADAKTWAAELIDLYETVAIAAPVYLEIIAGARTSDELRLIQQFLGEFQVIDRFQVPPADWQVAIQIAQRVPADGKPRQLGDSLIQAIAKRLRYEVISLDKRFRN
jgi:predicted nucleic acid-binding protein